MAFAFNLNINLSSQSNERGDLLTMSDDWARRKFEELKAQEGAANDATQIRTMERRQIMADAPHLWRDLREKLDERIVKFNALRPNYLKLAEPGTINESELISLTSPKGELNVEFFPASPRITYEETARLTSRPLSQPERSRTGTIVFVLTGNSVVALKNDDSGSPAVAVSKIAEYLLDFILL
jgi:hypothetical protein